MQHGTAKQEPPAGGAPPRRGKIQEGRRGIMTKEVFDSILKVKDSGRTNMFDTRAVQCIANEMGLYELVLYIEDHPKEYARFILTGREDG